MKYNLIVVALLVLCTACLNLDDVEDPNTVFNLEFKLADNAGENIILNSDTLTVVSASFIVNNIELVAQGENEIFEPTDVLVNISGFGFNEAFRVGAAEIFGGTYTGVTFNLSLADVDTDLRDPDLIVRNNSNEVIELNSFAIRGIYNNEPFIFKSNIVPEINIGFEQNVTMPEKLGTLNTVLIGDWEKWMIKDDIILDPNDPSNKGEIEERFKRYFYAELFTIGELN